MQLKFSLILILIIKFLCAEEYEKYHGENVPVESMPAKHTLGLIMARSLPTSTLKKNSKELKISPSYIKDTRDFRKSSDFNKVYSTNPYWFYEKDSGYAFSLSYTYGFNTHFGLSSIAGITKSTGTIEKNLPFATTTTRGKTQDFAYALGVSGIFDPFCENSKLKLPIMLGLSYSHAKGKRGPLSFTHANDPTSLGDHSNQPALQTKTYAWGGPGVILGIAPQMDIWKFRLILFGFAAEPFANNKMTLQERNPNTGNTVTINTTTEESGAEGAGIEIVYLPFNVSFTYIPKILSDTQPGENLNIYALTWRWVPEIDKKKD